MKPLDEVIKALELCTGDDCAGYECPYRQEGTCCDLVAVPKMQTDALHYLKEYRKRLIQDLDELRQKKYELETNMKLDAILQLKPWEKRK